MDGKLPVPSSHGGLRTKLILYHLLLTLGLLVLLTIAVLISIHNSFRDTQQRHVQMRAQMAAEQCEENYRDAGKNWDTIANVIRWGDEPSLEIIVDSYQHIKTRRVPGYLKLSQSEAQTVQQSILQSLKGNTVNGYLQDTGGDHLFSGFYLSQPLYDHGQLIGAMFFAEPDSFPPGFSPNN